MIDNAVIEKAASSRLVSLVKLGVLAVSVAAAVPTARDLYVSWQSGIPYSQVPHRLNQAALLEKNFDCRIDYRTLTTLATGRVDVGSCAKTSDISIKVSGAKGQVNYEWIAFDQLPRPVQAAGAAGLMNLFIGQAFAAVPATGVSVPPGAASALTRVVDDSVEVLCQSKKGNVILRVIKDKGGKCARETVSLLRGAVEKREDVPCDKSCPLPN
jgi:hypothetical protein